MTTAEARLAAFADEYLPDIAARGLAIVDALTRRVPGAVRMVYDNWNGLVVGFVPNHRPSEAILSVLFTPRWITLCFLQGAALDDPDGLLNGSGNIVRHLRLDGPAALDAPEISALIDQAPAKARVPIDPDGTGELVIRSVSPKRRPRRPGEGNV